MQNWPGRGDAVAQAAGGEAFGTRDAAARVGLGVGLQRLLATAGSGCSHGVTTARAGKPGHAHEGHDVLGARFGEHAA